MDSLSFFNYKLHEIEIEIETKLNTADYKTKSRKLSWKGSAINTLFLFGRRAWRASQGLIMGR